MINNTYYGSLSKKSMCVLEKVSKSLKMKIHLKILSDIETFFSNIKQQ